MSDALRIDAEDQAVIAEAKSAAAEYANAKSYPDVMSAQERLRSMGASAIPALLAENERLRARLTLTPERIEAAAKANYEADHPSCSWDAWDNSGWGQTLYRDSQRAALLAAGMEEKA